MFSSQSSASSPDDPLPLSLPNSRRNSACLPHRRRHQGLPSLLQNLQEIIPKENALSTLRVLNKIISSNQDELEFLYKSDGIQVITNFLTDLNLYNICLKILLNASKRHEKFRSALRNIKIFQLLANKLQNEMDLSESGFILTTALIILLVQGHREAQNLMRTSGCLSNMIQILIGILDEGKSLTKKNAELAIYAIIVSSKDPKQPQNQSEIGNVTPKVLEYLRKQSPSTNVDQLETAKCLWLLLKCALDQNEKNQEIFLNNSGLSVLFRNIQDIVDEGKCEQMGDLLAKMTGVLIKLKSHADFLYQASNYCPLMIIASLLKTGNTLVIQQLITFLDSLTKEIPQALEILKDPETLRVIKKARIMFLRSQMAAEFCQNLLDRMEIFDEISISQDDLPSRAFQFGSNNDYPLSCGFGSELDLLENCFCVVHDADTVNVIRSQSSLFPSLESDEEHRNRSKHLMLHGRKRSFGNLQLHRRDLREREKNLRKLIRQNMYSTSQKKLIRYNDTGNISRRIIRFFQKFISYFVGASVEDLKH